jgi:hypothetical protein
LRDMAKIVRGTGADVVGYGVLMRREEFELDAPLTYLFTPEDFSTKPH